MKTFDEYISERNYKKEYENYHSKDEQKKRRAGRNKARNLLKNAKGIKGKDVHHKDGNPENNDKNNLSIVTQHYNRREPRLREKEADWEKRGRLSKKVRKDFWKSLKKKKK